MTGTLAPSFVEISKNFIAGRDMALVARARRIGECMLGIVTAHRALERREHTFAKRISERRDALVVTPRQIDLGELVGIVARELPALCEHRASDPFESSAYLARGVAEPVWRYSVYARDGEQQQQQRRTHQLIFGEQTRRTHEDCVQLSAPFHVRSTSRSPSMKWSGWPFQ